MRTRLQPISSIAIALILAGACSEEAPLGPATLAVGPATNLTATAVDYQQIHVAWLDNARSENGWEVHRSTTGPSGTFSLLRTLSGNATELLDGGLQAHTQYCYKARSFKSPGPRTMYGEFSNVGCATTPAVPVLSVTPENSTEVRVNWYYGSNDESGFRLQRSTNGGATWTLVIETGVDASVFLDSGLSPEAHVCYRVFAFNSAGESAPSNTDCTTPPAGPTQLSATGIDAQTINLAWHDNSSVEDGYELQAQYCYYYYGYNLYCYLSYIAEFGANTTSYQLRDGNAYLYSYAVVARKDGGYSTWSNEAIPTPPPSGSTAGVRRP